MRRLLLVPAVLAPLALGACGSDDGAQDDPPAPEYSAGRVAPQRADLRGTGSDTTPDPEDALVELDLDDGGTGLVWIDQEDIRRVLFQASDPDDPDAWTEPTLVLEAGDGCLTLDADTQGTTVAVGAGCYETDAFIQQAPDQGMVAVTADLVRWEGDEVGESVPVPEVSDGGDSVVWRNEVYDGEVDSTWSVDDGF